MEPGVRIEVASPEEAKVNGESDKKHPKRSFEHHLWSGNRKDRGHGGSETVVNDVALDVFDVREVWSIIIWIARHEVKVKSCCIDKRRKPT